MNARKAAKLLLFVMDILFLKKKNINVNNTGYRLILPLIE